MMDSALVDGEIKGRTRLKYRISLLWALLLWIALPSFEGQNVTAQPEDGTQLVGVSVHETETPFEESVDVHLVNVEVRVADRKGRPIQGLTVEDFEVFEDRRQVEVLHFAEISQEPDLPKASEAVPSNLGTSPKTQSLEVPTETSSGQASVEEPGRLIFYFDNSNLRTAGRKRLIEDLRQLIRGSELDAERVLMLVQNPGLETLASFGSNESKLLAALDRLDEIPAEGHEADREWSLLMDRFNEIFELARISLGNPCTLLLEEGVRDSEAYARQVAARVGTTLSHLAGLSSALAGVPGPKLVLYFGGGLELIPSLAPIHFISEVCPQNEDKFRKYSYNIDLTSRFQRLTRHANANRVTFYMLDTSGLPTYSSSSVEYSNFDWKPSPVNDQVRAANLQNSLSFMASDTGGRAVFHTNTLEDQIRQIDADRSSFYSLAYRPLHDGDGKTHTIDVKLKKKVGKKARIRHRLSYRDKAGDERMADRLQGALTLGIEENPLKVELSRGEMVPGASNGGKGKTKGTKTIPMRVSMPLDSLVFLPREGKHLGRLRIQLAARDTEGKTSAFHQKHFEIELDPELEGTAEGVHSFIVSMEMSSGIHVVAVAVRDELSRETSYMASRITVP